MTSEAEGGNCAPHKSGAPSNKSVTPPSKGPKTAPLKRPSGAHYRKAKREKERLAHEARVALLAVQGRSLGTSDELLLGSWKPRPHQLQLEEAHQRGIRRQAHVWHRRAGKSAATLDFLARRALERPGNYWYLAPKLTQTRTAIWESRRADGIREIDIHIPREIRTRVQDNVMSIELLNGSCIKFLGSDGFDRLVGSNVAGLVFDEFALGDPASWDYLSPILAADPAAWAIFISTYRGKNHWYRQFQRVKTDPRWHTSELSIRDTLREDGQPIVTTEVINQERREGKAEGYIQQEYYNSPLAAFEGAFYSAAMQAMHKDGRLGPCGYDPRLPVVVAIDLGFADEMVFTFWQTEGNEHRIIGSRSWKFTGLPEALDDVKKTFPWGHRPMQAILPHDARFGGAELFERYGYDPILLERTSSVAREIEQVRAFLGSVRIDTSVREWTENEDNNARLVEALFGYRTAKANGEGEVYQRRPAHTWESHYCDAIRYYVAAVTNEEVGAVASTWGPAPTYQSQDRSVI